MQGGGQTTFTQHHVVLLLISISARRKHVEACQLCLKMIWSSSHLAVELVSEPTQNGSTADHKQRDTDRQLSGMQAAKPIAADLSCFVGGSNCVFCSLVGNCKGLGMLILGLLGILLMRRHVLLALLLQIGQLLQSCKNVWVLNGLGCPSEDYSRTPDMELHDCFDKERHNTHACWAEPSARRSDRRPPTSCQT